MGHVRRPFAEWFSWIKESLRSKDPLVWRFPHVWTLRKYRVAQAAYREYLETPLVWAAIDRTEIEQQFRYHFAMLNQTDRPVRWFESFGAAHEYLSGEAFHAIESYDEGDISELLESEGVEPEEIEHERRIASRAVCSRVWRMASEAADCAARQFVSYNVRDKLFPPRSWKKIKMPDSRDMALRICLEAARSEPDPRSSKVSPSAWETAKDTVSDWTEVAKRWALWSVVFEHAANDPEAQSAPAVSGRAACAAIRRAFVAGLWCFWVRDSEVVAVPAPNLYTDRHGQLDRYEGPAIEWPGEGYWFASGMQCTPRPERLASSE